MDRVERLDDMLKVDEARLDEMEKQRPGIKERILEFENAELPPCPHCRSEDTADVQVGLVGQTINIAAATSKFALIANGPRPGEYRCNSCERYFGAPEEGDSPELSGGARGFTGRPRNKSLQAYKDFILGVVKDLGMKPEPVSEEEWKQDWRKFWAEGGEEK